MKQLSITFGVLFTVLALAFGVMYVFDLGTGSSQEPAVENTRSIPPASSREIDEKLAQATELGKAADYERASEIFEEVARDPDGSEKYSPNQIASARRSTIFRYRVTGDPKDSLESIRDLKANILDDSTSKKHRARSLNTLATAHCWFARDDEVIEEIYGKEPFARHWSGDPTQAVRNMLIWSYDGIYKTPKAAASLAYWYMDQVLKHDYVKEEISEGTRIQYIQEAKRYVAEADALAKRDEAENPKYLDRQRYIGYLYRRAFAIGGLAVAGEASVEELNAAYELFFTEVQRQNNHNGSGFIPFSYVLQAQFSQLLGEDDAIARAYLEQAVREVEADPVPQANELVDFIGDKTFDADGRFSWHAIHNMREVSDVFDAFVTEVEDANKE